MTTPPDIDDLANYLARRAGIDFVGSRGRWLREALGQAIGDRPGGVAEALRLLDAEPDAFARLCDVVTVQESFFFRERSKLDLVCRHILPSLREPEDRIIRVWSAGCAAGEEVYTLAVLLTDAGLAHRANVLGTDVSAGAVEAAGKAIYGRWALRGLDNAGIARFLSLRRAEWQVHARFRALVAFEQHNLLDPPPIQAGGFDLVMCRNVLIYLTPTAVKRVVSHLVSALSPGGWLVTSASDPLLDTLPGLEAVHTEYGTAYRRAREVRATCVDLPGQGLGMPPPPSSLRRARSEGPVLARRQPFTGGSVAASEAAAAEAEAQRALAMGSPIWAERLARLILTGETSPTAHCLLVRALGEQGRAREAVQAVERALDAHPLHAELHRQHAFLLLDGHNVSAAMAAARRAVYLDPGSVLGHVVLARCHEVLGEPAAARRGLRNARRLISGGASG